jgi:DNA-3-methyladenine glycosylase II
MDEANRSGSDERVAQLRRGQHHLRQVDPVIGHLIDLRPDFDPYAWLNDLPPLTLFGSLLFQITGQQLSVAATRRTVDRLRVLFGGHLPSPEEVLVVEPAALRDAGLSWRKVQTVRDLAERFADGRLEVESLKQMSDDDFIRELTVVPGIGPWTAQGALLVALRREDVVLPGDLALRKAIRSAYRLDHLPSQDEVLQIAERWRPFRSLATSYLFAGVLGPEDPEALSTN